MLQYKESGKAWWIPWILCILLGFLLVVIRPGVPDEIKVEVLTLVPTSLVPTSTTAAMTPTSTTAIVPTATAMLTATPTSTTAVVPTATMPSRLRLVVFYDSFSTFEVAQVLRQENIDSCGQTGLIDFQDLPSPWTRGDNNEDGNFVIMTSMGFALYLNDIKQRELPYEEVMDFVLRGNELAAVCAE